MPKGAAKAWSSTMVDRNLRKIVPAGSRREKLSKLLLDQARRRRRRILWDLAILIVFLLVIAIFTNVSTRVTAADRVAFRSVGLKVGAAASRRCMTWPPPQDRLLRRPDLIRPADRQRVRRLLQKLSLKVLP